MDDVERGGEMGGGKGLLGGGKERKKEGRGEELKRKEKKREEGRGKREEKKRKEKKREEGREGGFVGDKMGGGMVFAGYDDALSIWVVQ